MGILDFLPSKEKAVDTPTNRPPAGPSSGASVDDAPPAYHAVGGPATHASVSLTCPLPAFRLNSFARFCSLGRL